VQGAPSKPALTAPSAGDSRRGYMSGGRTLLRVKDTDRLVVGGTVSVAAGTLAIYFATGHDMVAAIFQWIFAAAAVAAFVALPLPRYRRALAWLRSHSLGGWSRLRRQRPVRVQTPVVRDRWRFTTDGMQYPRLARMAMDGFGHRGYQRPSEITPAFVRIKALVACGELEEDLAWQDLRGRFLGLISHEWLMTLISELGVIAEDATWQSRATSRRSWLEADLAGGEEGQAPAASAKLLLPAAGVGPAGTDPRYAEMIVHIDVSRWPGRAVTAGEGARSDSAIPDLQFWRRQASRALAMPDDLEHFLRHDLGLTTMNDPPVQFGFLLEAREAITEIVNPGGIRALPATYVVPEYSGFAIADPDGLNKDDMAAKMILDLSERILHLDGTQEEMSGLTPPARPVTDTWTSRDLPVLRAVVTSLDQPRAFAVTVAEIAAQTSLDPHTVAKALEALEGRYIAKFHKLLTGGIPNSWYVTKVTPAARRAVGQWPASA
jgi:hypothetical protein